LYKIKTTKLKIRYVYKAFKMHHVIGLQHLGLLIQE